MRSWPATDGPGTNRNVSLLGQRVVREDPQAVADEVAGWVADMAQRAVDDHGSFSIALAGGSTPRLLYNTLAGPTWRDRVEWPAWRVYFGDERACPADDPSSNYHLADTTLLSLVSIDPSHVHRMPAERADLDAAALEYSNLLPSSLPTAADGAPRLDVVLLGLGENGHTASLFPGTPALDVSDRWTTRGLADYVPFDRMTLTYPAINAAAAVGFMVTGSAKVPALAATARGEVPASRVNPADGVLLWFLDAAAAS
jgi:6-phosphogluconolactonase